MLEEIYKAEIVIKDEEMQFLPLELWSDGWSALGSCTKRKEMATITYHLVCIRKSYVVEQKRILQYLTKEEGVANWKEWKNGIVH